uniref:Si:dkey-242h9.3 n=1 Tax=Nothobranchius pienaari TaxID=704102 RepID=A0A1A8MMA2_9TELE
MREESAVQVPTVCPNSSPGQWQQRDDTTSLLHEVLVKQETILQQQHGLTKMVQDLFVAVAALQGLTTGGSAETRHHGIFPLADVQALMALERELGISPTLAHEMGSTLGLAGGSTVKDTVWRVLKGAMTNALAEGKMGRWPLRGST